MQKGAVTDLPDEAGFDLIFEHKFLRFAGPTAPYPNMDFELTNLSGLAAFEEAELVSVTYHAITNIHELAGLKNLKSIFVNDNKLTSIEGIEDMTWVLEMYVHNNSIDSIKPIEKLTNLKAFYCNANLLTSLDGLTEDHGDHLRHFVCLPNEGIKQREIIRVENTLGIKCRGTQ